MVSRFNNAGAFVDNPFLIQRATGNVGIGTSAPASKLEVMEGDVRIRSTTANRGLILDADAAVNLANVISFRRSDSRRWQLVGSNGNGGVDDFMVSRFNNAGAFLDNPFLIQRATGNVGIGTAAPAERLHVIGNVRVEGDIFATGTISVPSDLRFKTALEPLTGALEKLEAVQAVSFERNALGESLGQPGGRRELGVLAQELEAVYPELVTADGPEAYRAVDYSKLTVVLLEALKELKRQDAVAINELKLKNAALQDENHRLNERYTTLEKRVKALESTREAGSVTGF